MNPVHPSRFTPIREWMSPDTSQRLDRRELLRTSLLLGGIAAGSSGCHSSRLTPALSSADDAFLGELERTGCRYFVEAAHPETGQVLDRRLADGQPESRTVSSIAATGFGLSALCIADVRGYAPRETLRKQVIRTLAWLRHHQPQHEGFYYHFFHWGNGERMWKCELSSVDSALLFCGVLHARAHFDGDPLIQSLATSIVERARWPWFLNGSATFSMGWKPESGFLASRWDHYCELMLIYLLGLGSGTHPLNPASWRAWTRPIRTYFGERFVWSPAPLFVHQFSHAWFDFAGRRDDGVDWFENSVAATRAHIKWSLDQRGRFERWSEDLWGVTSSDSAKGYVGWGGPPDSGPLDGTIVPCAAAGSLPFLPTECLRTLRFQREKYGDKIWKR